MENTPSYISAADMAMYSCSKHNGRAVADTGLAFGASALGIAIFGGLALAYGLNSASKARSQGNAATIAQQSKTMEMLAATINREAVRADGITIDVQQTLRSLSGQTQSALAQGGSAASNALATAEAMALLNNNSNGVNSAIGGCNYLRVARVSGSSLCGCDGNSCG
jgi:hypothetical protein